MSALWQSIPAPIRTIINVALGAAVAAAVSYLLTVISGGSFNAGALLTVVLTAVGTAVVKAINPADSSYGLGSSTPAPIDMSDVPSSDIVGG